MTQDELHFLQEEEILQKRKDLDEAQAELNKAHFQILSTAIETCLDIISNEGDLNESSAAFFYNAVRLQKSIKNLK